METKNIFGFLVAVLALILIAPAVSAFATIDDGGVTVNGIQHYDGGTAGVFAGETVSVRVVFTANEDEDDVRVLARILGEPGLSDNSEEFDVLNGSTYSRLMHLQLPSDLDDETEKPFTLEVVIESNSERADSVTVFLEVQRENDLIEILSVASNDEVRAGENLLLDVVVKNFGRDKAEDVFIEGRIEALGEIKRIFVGDLYPKDHENEDEEDTVLGRLALRIPRNAPAGLYNVEIEAFSDDASVITTRKVVVLGASANSNVISSTTSKTFAVGQEQTYTLTIVNADNTIKVYELILEAANGLTINLDRGLVAVPAGSTETIVITAVASEKGNYNFAVNVHSGGELVKKQNFVANVEGKSAGTGNAAVVLTVILAIIFVVLLIVLIVLLTRKPEKSEDLGESYY
jgi:uncharacterized membrane protein